jgi:hypothetical protein
MICFFIKVGVQFLFLNIVENCNFDNIKTFSHCFSKSSSVCQRTLLFVLFFRFFLSMLSVNLFDKLNFQNGSIAIIDVCQPIRGSLRKLSINPIVVMIICCSYIQESFQILGIHLILFNPGGVDGIH